MRHRRNSLQAVKGPNESRLDPTGERPFVRGYESDRSSEPLRRPPLTRSIWCHRQRLRGPLLLALPALRSHSSHRAHTLSLLALSRTLGAHPRARLCHAPAEVSRYRDRAGVLTARRSHQLDTFSQAFSPVQRKMTEREDTFLPPLHSLSGGPVRRSGVSLTAAQQSPRRRRSTRGSSCRR